MNLAIDQPLAFAVFQIFLVCFFIARFLLQHGAHFSLRPLAGFAALKQLLAQSIETNLPIHLSLGIAGIGARATAETTAALQVLEYLADGGALGATPPLVTCADPTVLPVAQDILRLASERQGYASEFDDTRARWIAPEPLAYAAGMMQLLSEQALTANMMLGEFGDEFLLLGEPGAQKNWPQIGGTSTPRVLPFLQTTMTDALIGEEIFAAGAYLGNRPAHHASLVAQDLARWLLVSGVIITIALKSLGLI